MSIVNNYTMTTKQAAKLLGVTPVTIQQAIIAGRLPAEKRKVKTLAGRRPTYFVDPSDLSKYEAYRNRKPQATKWTEDMDQAVVELLSTCTVKQIAAYLGVTEASVRSRKRVLGAAARSGHRPMSPFQVPKTGLLLAKTCTECGELLDACCFHDSGGRKNAAAKCRPCINKTPWRREASRRGKAARRVMNSHTYEKAVHHRDEWTTADDEYLTKHNDSKSTYEIALDLGRTMNAVQHRRRAIGLTAPMGSESTDGRWMVDFPATQEEVESYFKALNRAVPEELWEWSDENPAIA